MENRKNESQAAVATTILIVCPSIALIFVALRVYTRFVVTKKYFMEDYMIIVAMVHAIATSIFMGLAVLNGAGRHIEFVTHAELTGLRKASIGTIHFYTATHFFLKLSILLQYVRLSVTRAEKRTCYTLIFILACGTMAFTIINLAQCRPFAAQWDSSIPGARCTINNTIRFYAGQAFHIFLDVSIVIFPIFILRHLRVPMRQKLLIAIVLGFGGISCIASIIRLHTLYKSTTSTDPTWDKNPSGYYAQVEVNLGIACASIVTLRPLWRKLTGKDLHQPQAPPREMELRLNFSAFNKTPTSQGSTRPLRTSSEVDHGPV